MKKLVIAMIAALALGACTGGEGTQITVADIVAKIQKACDFQTDARQIAQVVATVVSGFDPAAGATATVAVAIGDQVATKVCDAVKAKTANTKPQLDRNNISPPTTVIVNGVEVQGVVRK